MAASAALFLAAFLHVGLKAAQQLNVVGGRYNLILPTSLLLATAEVLVTVKVVAVGWTVGAILPLAFGGALGCVASMKLHERMRNR